MNYEVGFPLDYLVLYLYLIIETEAVRGENFFRRNRLPAKMFSRLRVWRVGVGSLGIVLSEGVLRVSRVRVRVSVITLAFIVYWSVKVFIGWRGFPTAG